MLALVVRADKAAALADSEAVSSDKAKVSAGTAAYFDDTACEEESEAGRE